MSRHPKNAISTGSPTSYTIVVVDVSTMKTTFDFNFDFYQVFRHHMIHINIERKRSCELTNSLCSLVNLKNLAVNQNVNRTVVFIA